MRKAIVLAAVLGLVGSLWAADPSTGTWKLNLAKSKIPSLEAANIKEVIMEFREIDADTLGAVSTETLKDGKTNTMKWTTPLVGGMQTYQQGGPAEGVSTVAVKIDQYTIYNMSLRDGKQVSLFKITFSKDFKTYTVNAKGMDAEGNPWEYLAVYDKQ